MSKNHCGDPEACQKEPYSEDACDCSCDRCGPWADERDEREQQVPAGTSIEATTQDRRFGKSTMLVDFVLDAANSGEEVLCSTPTPNTFESRLQERAVERGLLVWSKKEKYGIRVTRKL